jgi:hypothetical protein
MIGIETNVPVIDITGRGRKTKYPVANMKVGDSFFAENGGVGDGGVNTIGSVSRWQRKHQPDWLFISRTEGTGVRVWRLK